MSAACLFGGVFTLIGAMELQAGVDRRLWALIGAVNFYELLLIALAIAVIRTRVAMRDGRFLLMVMGLIIGDATFLIFEATTGEAISGQLGFFIAGGFLLLAAAKLSVVAGVVGLRFYWHWWWFTLTALAATLIVGPLFGMLSTDGLMSRLEAYPAWWVAGLLLALGPAGHWLHGHGRRRLYAPSIYRWLLLVLPGLLIAHLAAAGWVYRAHFHFAFAAPLVLGLAVWLPRLLRHDATFGMATKQMAIVGLALFFALSAGAGQMTFGTGPIVWSPMRLTLVAAGVATLVIAWQHRCGWFAVGTVALGGFALLGPSPYA